MYWYVFLFFKAFCHFSSVALDLVRLGVKKIFILDKDVVDEHNLNRQILFSKEDVGQPKVYSAAKVEQTLILKRLTISLLKNTI